MVSFLFGIGQYLISYSQFSHSNTTFRPTYNYRIFRKTSRNSLRTLYHLSLIACLRQCIFLYLTINCTIPLISFVEANITWRFLLIEQYFVLNTLNGLKVISEIESAFFTTLNISYLFKLLSFSFYTPNQEN